MSFKYNFGDGRLGDCEIADGVFTKMNSYARVLAVDKNVITIDAENQIEGEISTFKAGETILLHISATNGTDATPLGKYQLAQIDLIVENVLTLNEKVFDCDLNYEYLQIISVPQFKNLTLKNATLAPQPYDVFKFRGGVLVFQVFDTFKMENSAIDLTDAGIPFQKKMTYRPLTSQEISGETDGAIYAGQENYITAGKLIMNAGDGVFFMQAKKFLCDTDSRIGNPKTHGRANCRGAADSKFKPSNVTNIGGSTILISSEKLEIRSKENSLTTDYSLLTPILAKYRDSEKPAGRGLARCYIASDTILPKDEKLYAFDILEDDSRVQKLGVEDFGNGELGTVENPNYELNNYAAVKYLDGNRVYYENKTLSGIAPLKLGALVILQNIETGEFAVSRVLEYDEKFVTLKKVIDGSKLQLITVAEFEKLTVGNFAQVRKFDGKIGGVLALAVSDSLEIDGEINAKVQETLEIGNSQSFNRLQVGSMFILSKKIIFGDMARLVGDTLIIGGEMEGFESVKTLGGNNFVHSQT